MSHNKLLPVVHSTSWEAIEQLAESLRRKGFFPELQKGEPADIIRFFEADLPGLMATQYRVVGFNTGVRDLEALLNRRGLEGYTNAQEKYSYLDEALYYDESRSGQRRLRSTAGHEVYHCIQHVPIMRDFISANGGLPTSEYYREGNSIPAYQHPEIQADIFSGCILMPRRELRVLDREGKLTEDYLVARFDVNPAFVRSRLRRKTIKS